MRWIGPTHSATPSRHAVTPMHRCRHTLHNLPSPAAAARTTWLPGLRADLTSRPDPPIVLGHTDLPPSMAAVGPSNGGRPEMSPTRPRAIFATATRHPGEGLYHSHHVSWAATPAQLTPPTRHLLPDKGAGAPAHSYAPAPHSRKNALRRPNRTSQRGDRGRIPAHYSCRTPIVASRKSIN